MRLHISFLFAAIAVSGAWLASGCAGVSSARVQVNPRIASYKVRTVAILPFEGVEVTQEVQEFSRMHIVNYPRNGETVSDILATELMALPSFTYIERSQIRRILGEQKLSLSDLVSKKSASEIGKLMNADAVILGTVGKMQHWSNILGMQGCDLQFSARMVHTETGAVLWSANVGRKDDGNPDVPALVRQECQGIAAQLRVKLNP